VAVLVGIATVSWLALDSGEALATGGFPTEQALIARYPGEPAPSELPLVVAPAPPNDHLTAEERVALVEAPAPLPAWELERLVTDLAHDYVKDNALKAMAALRRVQHDAAPLLEKALYSHDRQQRQLAAFLLREFVSTPCDRLLEITVEGLHTDRIPCDPEGKGNLEPEMDNAVQGTCYLVDHTARAKRFLLDGLFSQDPQQRFLCAFLVAKAGIQTHLWRTCEILIPHLADNNINADALLSSHALHGLGKPALEYLRSARSHADRQALQLLNLIELDIVNPPRTAAEFAGRKEMQEISVHADPVIELDVRDTPFPSWEGLRDHPPLPPR